MLDVQISNHGSIVLLSPLTKEAMGWFGEHIPEDAQWFGRALAVEPRYVAAIVEGAREDGLEVGE